jgi:rubrerythrin
VKEQIIEAQRQIILNLVRWETSTAELYEAYASRLPEMKELWTKLSKEEHSHAAMLDSLLKQLSKGFLFFNLGSFEASSIEDEIKVVRAALNEAKLSVLTPKTALLTAMKIENLMIESRFYSQTASEDPSYTHIAKALQCATVGHFDLLYKKMTELSITHESET